MTTTISEYYSAELIDWNHAINFYCNEMDELGEKLANIIRRDSIEKIAKKIEDQQHLLNSMAGRFSKLQVEIFYQEKILQKENGALREDGLIDDTLQTTQAVLRLNIQAAEKEYIDIKYGCYNLLAELVAK